MAKFPKTVVGIDVETTSLDPNDGDIIEIAAIRYDLSTEVDGYIGQEVAEFNKLAQPTNPLSDQITAITGITNDMVKDTQPFSHLLPDLQEFIGDHTLFAHNATFDTSFLIQHGLTINQKIWDTFTLAGIAWPQAPSYNLGTLAADLNIKVAGEHRAGDDVRLTWELLNRAYQEFDIDDSYYEYIVNLLRSSSQSHYQPFFRSRETGKTEANEPATKRAKYSMDYSSAEIFGPHGILSKNRANFQYREEQLNMAEAIENNISEHKIGYIEAGTGVGKTYAYLVPLIRAAVDNKPSIVSTHTKNLQDQIIKHDIPELAKALDIKLNAASLKGRRNYLCLTRLLQALSRDTYQPNEAMLLIKILFWLDQGSTGDLEQFNTSHQQVHLLNHLHADAISCRLTCPQEQPNCPYQRARRSAEQADLVVINHALLVQLTSEDAVLPLTNLVIDEAHHVEEVTRDSTRRDLSEHHVADIVAPFVQLTAQADNYQHITSEAQLLLTEYQQLITDLKLYLAQTTTNNSLRLTTATRKSESWKKIVKSSITWRGRLQFLIGLIEGMSFDTKQAYIMKEAASAAGEFLTHLEQFIDGHDDRIQWLESWQKSPQEIVFTIHDVALVIVDQLADLYHRAHSITFTSATLTTGSDFSYIKRRLGTDGANETRLGSPFNYQDQMLIYIVDDGPNPGTEEFDNIAAQNVVELSKILSGRTLGLFTSHQSVRQVYFKAVKHLNNINIKLLAQKMSGGRHNIMARFKKTPHSTLLGTYSFWEGVDVPGDSLSCLIIPKLPFAPPHDPITDAIAEAENVSSFMSLALPHMLLRLRQGVGRLIRSNDDRGVVVMLDSRFLTKEYGKRVLESLPPATVHIGSFQDLIPKVRDWFGDDQLQVWQQQKDKKQQQKDKK